jgi:ribose transport system ATP-binding protein
LEDEVLLNVSNITKTFPGTKALSDVSFKLKRGEVHSIMGENGAGKSTLMNIIAGVFKQDSGEIIFDGKTVNFSTPKEAQNAGVGFVHQELSVCPDLSVAENIYIGRVPTLSGGIIDFNKLYSDCSELLKLFKTNINPRDKVKELSVAEQQIVEIARSISLNCKLLILDEPTSSLSESEAELLFDIVKQLKNKGISVLYISHRMAEIFNISDEITVLRDGKFIATLDTDKTNEDEIIKMMVGREIGNLYPDKGGSTKEEIFKVKNFSAKGVFKDINFNLYRGEVLGFSGLVGAGRSEVMRAICGIDHKDSGEIFLQGKKLEIKNFRDAISNGIGYLTEDRKMQGLFLNLSIEKNISAADLKNVSGKVLISGDSEKNMCDKYKDKLNIKISSGKQPMGSLSGGNQQKVMIAKWLAINPKIIIMDEPTRGIDVGAKAEIHRLLRELAKNGIGVIMVSSEMPEIIGMCDRVIVMHEGSIKGIVSNEDINEEKIMFYASGKIA